jgi:hypothetical protein
VLEVLLRENNWMGKKKKKKQEKSLPLSKHNASSLLSLPWRDARKGPSMMGKSTVYMSDEGPSNSMNCVSYGTSFPDDPILCVIHQSLKRKQHINLMPLLKNKTNHRSTSVFHTPKLDIVRQSPISAVMSL